VIAGALVEAEFADAAGRHHLDAFQNHFLRYSI
jgi:hypothetical protein